MAKSRNERLGDYYANRSHVVGSEAWLTDEELAVKERIEERENPNHPNNSPEAKAARERYIDELLGKPVKLYENIRG